MIKAEQVPMEVKRAMRAAWARRNNSDAPEKHMVDLLIAAINAWPGVRKSQHMSFDGRVDSIVLPLPLTHIYKEHEDDY